MKHLQSLTMILLIPFIILATGFFVPPSADAHEDITKSPFCPLCGMDRQKFAHCRTYIPYEDGSSFSGCSIHCAAVELAINIDKTPLEIQVADYREKTLIDAEKAAWVLGGDIPGVMTRRAKWAFSTKRKAQQFIQTHGGTLATFDQIMKATYEDMYADTKMIREKRKKMRMMKQKKTDSDQ